MKSINLLFILLFAPTLVFANDLLFNRLTKLYGKDQDKCLEAAERFMNYFPNESSSYYYASKVCFDKSIVARNNRTEYSLLKKAISYAAKFEKTDHKNLAERVNWTMDKATLKTSVISLSNKLSSENQQSLSTSLVIAYSKLDQQVEIPDIAENTTFEKAENPAPPNVNKGFMFGMPSGTENVHSSNLAEEKALLLLINKERQKLGMEPLIWEEKLAKAARYHAFDLGSQKYFDHNTYDRVNGELVKVGGTFTRIGRFYSASSLNSENIAAGSETAYGTYVQWFDSKGHYDNMFNKQSKKVGIGFYYDENAPLKFYWVFCTAM
jgi:uncharacterized protein YkwD